MLLSSPLAANSNSNGTFKDSLWPCLRTHLSPPAAQALPQLLDGHLQAPEALDPHLPLALSLTTFSLSSSHPFNCMGVAPRQRVEGVPRKHSSVRPISLSPALSPSFHLPCIVEEVLGTQDFLMLYIARDAELPILFERPRLLLSSSQPPPSSGSHLSPSLSATLRRWVPSY